MGAQYPPQGIPPHQVFMILPPFVMKFWEQINVCPMPVTMTIDVVILQRKELLVQTVLQTLKAIVMYCIQEKTTLFRKSCFIKVYKYMHVHSYIILEKV